MAKIKPKEYEYYLVIAGNNMAFTPSGYAICQYIEGHFFAEPDEVTIDEFNPIIIKHLKQE